MLTNLPGHLWRDKWTALSGPLSEGAGPALQRIHLGGVPTACFSSSCLPYVSLLTLLSPFCLPSPGSISRWSPGLSPSSCLPVMDRACSSCFWKQASTGASTRHEASKCSKQASTHHRDECVLASQASVSRWSPASVSWSQASVSGSCLPVVNRACSSCFCLVPSACVLLLLLLYDSQA